MLLQLRAGYDHMPKVVFLWKYQHIAVLEEQTPNHRQQIKGQIHYFARQIDTTIER